AHGLLDLRRVVWIAEEDVRESVTVDVTRGTEHLDPCIALLKARAEENGPIEVVRDELPPVEELAPLDEDRIGLEGKEDVVESVPVDVAEPGGGVHAREFLEGGRLEGDAAPLDLPTLDQVG